MFSPRRHSPHRRRLLRGAILAAAWLALAPSSARAQSAADLPLFQPEGSLLGPAPGEGGGSIFPGTPGGQEGVLGGGNTPRRVPLHVTRPPAPVRLMQAPAELIPKSGLHGHAAPNFGPLGLPPGDEDEGPPDGLTLDAAIDLLVRENLSLRAKRAEIPQAQADVLTAGLRANPLVYGGAQLIPYGRYSNDHPGGPVQYDLNLNVPLDVTHKRQARVVVANQARRVLEAQYQDAVRQEIANLHVAYVDVLAARETLRFARTSYDGLQRVLQITERLKAGTLATQAEVNQIKIQRDAAELGVLEAEALLRGARRSLSLLLNVPWEYAERLEVRGSIRDQAPEPPPPTELVPLALAARPDVAAFRLGIGRAQADVGLARANRLQDVYLLYQPFTYQNLAPFGASAPPSWTLGATVAVPLFDRNQGNIRRAQINVDQTRLELRALEQIVAHEVEQAHREYVISRGALRRIETELLPDAEQMLAANRALYANGEAPLLQFIAAQRDFNDLVRQYRDTLVRHRRSMLDLNTALGQRLMP